ncbi:MAG: ATP-binding protein [Pyrinomonadaceae bacterium]
MLEEKPKAERAEADGAVVYARIRAPEDETGREPGAEKGGRRGPHALSRIAPTLTPLVVGFALLLALIMALSYLSVRQLEEVSREVLDLERQYAGKLSILLRLRTATTKLDNEARARQATESRNEISLPFDARLRTARNELKDVLTLYDHLPLAQTQEGRNLRSNITSFIDITGDLNRYSLEGFSSFRAIDTQLEAILRDTSSEQEEILRRGEESQAKARRSIYLLTLIALVVGAIVAAGTIREVQRRFREMRQGLEMARRERQFSRQMLEGMVSAIAAVDAHDRIRSANAAFFEIFPQATIGASVYDKFASPDAMKMLEAAIATRVERATYRGRWVCDPDDPKCAKRSFDIYSSPLVMDGEPGQIVTLVDVTEAAESEAGLRRTESLAAVGQAAAQVAHEIKNPLGSIRLGVSMLRDMTTDEESISTIDLIERGIDHLNKLAVDVTQFSRQKPLSRSEVDLHRLLDASIELVADRIREKGTTIEKEFSRETLRGEWDADQLRQVFVNLLANAIDASEAAAPVNIKVERVTSEDRATEAHGNGQRARPGWQSHARVTIADQGIGMDEETRARIFEPFFTTKKRGTGLGLAIVKQIIEQHGGTIAITSAPHQGTRFTIDLPLIA